MRLFKFGNWIVDFSKFSLSAKSFAYSSGSFSKIPKSAKMLLIYKKKSDRPLIEGVRSIQISFPINKSRTYLKTDTSLKAYEANRDRVSLRWVMSRVVRDGSIHPTKDNHHLKTSEYCGARYVPKVWVAGYI